MAKLYPTFEVPKVIEEQQLGPNPERESVRFDFEKGDFITNGAGALMTAKPHDAWAEWCLKTVYTQRYAFLAYSNYTGAEVEESLAQTSKASQEAMLERTITEALMADPYGRTVYLRDFIFEWHVDSLHLTFTVGSIWSTSEVITAKL